MQQEMLLSGSVAKIIFIYVDGAGLNKKERVTLSYMDKKHCYFRSTNTENFHKPNWRTKAKVLVYTPEGVYETSLIIRDAISSYNDVVFEVDIPKEWKLKQVRNGIRKKVELPVSIEFADNVCIDMVTTELSVTGFSLISNHLLTNVQKSFPAKGSIQFPTNLVAGLPDGKLDAQIKFVRQKVKTDDYNFEDYTVMSFKFVSLTPEQKIILKNYLMRF